MPRKSAMWWLTTIAGVLGTAAGAVAASNAPEEIRAPAGTIAMIVTLLLGTSHSGKTS